ncbi:MAG: hypothetical protein H0U82_01170 [Actinobacteria bacterium]|nr:hypothetical protein [Actinomycetota bacterium]
MSRAPAWARDEQQPSVEETGQERMQAEVAADRLHIRGVGHLPLDPAAARFELTEEERALRSSRPRNRRWKALDKHDAEIARLTQKRADAHARLHEAEEALRQAPERDAETLAAWIAGDERGERPASTAYERQRERDAARLLVEAVTIELDRALERGQSYIEHHRRKMIADARGGLDEKVGKLEAASRQLLALREAALEAREVLEWIASFPEPRESFGFPTATALGLRKPVEETLGTRARVEYASLVQALEGDAQAIRNQFGPVTAKQLGLAEPATPLIEAMWDHDVDPGWKREQLERARGLLPWTADPAKLADEAGDFRP